MKATLLPFAGVLLFSAVGQAQEVTLPLERYEALRARARVRPDTQMPVPASFALEAAQLEVVVGRQSARVSQRLTLSIFADGWVSVPLGAESSLTSVQLGTLDGRIDKKAGLALVARGLGRHSIRLEGVVPLQEDETAARSTRTVAIALPLAAAVTGTLVAGEDVEEVVVLSGGALRKAPAPQRFEFVGEPGTTLNLQLLGKGRLSERKRLPARFSVVSHTVAQLTRTRTRVNAGVNIEVTSGQLEGLDLRLPKGFDVVSVAPPNLGWTVEGDSLRITPPAPIERSLAAQVVLIGEPLQSFVSPLLVPKGATRMTLLTAVQATGDEIPKLDDPGSSRKAETVELALLPDEARKVAALFLLVRDPERAPRWTTTWPEESKVLAAQVDRLVVNAMVGSAGRTAYQLWATVRSSGSTELVLDLPDGIELVSVERDGIAVVPGVSERNLVIPLGSGEVTQIVHLVGLLPGITIPAEGQIAVPLPSASVPIGRAEVAVRLPGDRSYSLIDPDRARSVSDVPQPRTLAPSRRVSKPGGAGELDLSVLAGGLSSAPGKAAGWFEAPPQSVLLQAGWSALSKTLGPLAIRVRPSRERGEEWF